jgi:hypothetical protein
MPATFAHQTLQTGAQTKDVTSSFLRRKVVKADKPEAAEQILKVR